MDLEKVKKGTTPQLNKSAAINDEDSDYIGGPEKQQRESSSEDSLENELNEIASDTFNPKLF